MPGLGIRSDLTRAANRAPGTARPVDDLQTLAEKKANGTGKPIENPVFHPGVDGGDRSHPHVRTGMPPASRWGRAHHVAARVITEHAPPSGC